MYLKATTTYYRGTSQHTSKAPFLLLVQPEIQWDKGESLEILEQNPPRAIVRQVALRQIGHWLMGFARIMGKTYSVSGSYGADGLTMDVPREVYDAATPLPEELVKAWSNGGTLTPQMIAATFANARILARYAVDECNRGELTPRQAKREKRLIQVLRDFYGDALDVNGDPRGYVVKIKLPSGRYNNWGGEAWGVA